MKYFPKISRGSIYLSPVNPEDYKIFTKRWNDSNITDMLGASQDIITLNYMRGNIDKNRSKLGKDIIETVKGFGYKISK